MCIQQTFKKYSVHQISRRWLVSTAILFVFLILEWGCLSFNDDKPKSTASYRKTPWGRDLSQQIITRSRARDILAELPESDLATLRQLMFIADLQMASGNENSPIRIYRRIERELAKPLVISERDFKKILADMSDIVGALPTTKTGEEMAGYQTVSVMLQPVQGSLPSTGDCFEEIAKYPEEIVIAFLVQEFFSDHHYHSHNMQSVIFNFLVSGGHGPKILAVIEGILIHGYPNDNPDSDYYRATREGRKLMGDHFEEWYRELRGTSWKRELDIDWD